MSSRAPIASRTVKRIVCPARTGSATAGAARRARARDSDVGRPSGEPGEKIDGVELGRIDEQRDDDAAVSFAVVVSRDARDLAAEAPARGARVGAYAPHEDGPRDGRRR